MSIGLLCFTSHVSRFFLSFTYASSSSSILVVTIDGTLMPLTGVDSIVIPHLSLPNVYLISKLRLNLASVSQLCDSDYYLIIFLFFLLYTRSIILEAN